MENNTLQIRLVTLQDWQGLYDLIEPVDKKMVGMVTETEELVEEWINTITEGIWEVYVAILPQEEIKLEQEKLIRKILLWMQMKDNPSGIVGLVTLFGDWQDDEDLERGEFDIGITVAKAFQKKGIGRKLLEFIINRGKELNYDTATLWTRIDNAPMIKLAKKLGFVEGSKRIRQGFKWINYKLELKKEEKKE
ncbi:MAG: GNAT family N-acetyltransferase [Asgard group archaeon]|nr:GNAT family N-acetyltransferase [Asgard group archaeon]